MRERPLRLPVERVETQAGEGTIAGTIASGTLQHAQRVCIQPGLRESTVVRITTGGTEVEQAVAGRPVLLSLSDAVDVSPGDLVCAADAPAPVANQFEATIVWMSAQPLLRGRNYLMRIGSSAVTATVAPLKHKINFDTLEKVAASKLERGEVGEVAVELDRPIAFDSYRENRSTGGFVLFDRIGQEQVGMGMLRFALRRADNVHWQALEVDKRARQALAGHRSGVIWMTGLSGAGKSTLANMLEKRLHARGLRTYLLDGDNVRHGLNKDLGFTAADRVENIRRIAEVAKLMVDAGIIVITAFISPFRAERRMARELLNPGEFVEVFVDTPLEVAEGRDPKGLYGKARRGELKNFTGIDSPYEVPENPEVRVDTVSHSIEAATQQIYDALIGFGLIAGE
jgi:bifunctional enzyme CysN/CysC